MTRRHELSDAEWAVLSRLLPSSGTAGRPRSNDRVVLNGITWRLRTGLVWRDVPERVRLPADPLHPLRRWALDGTYSRMLKAIQAEKGTAGDIDWLASIHSTIVRAHQPAHHGREGGAADHDEVSDHAHGRSCGGLSTKVHRLCGPSDHSIEMIYTYENLPEPRSRVRRHPRTLMPQPRYEAWGSPPGGLTRYISLGDADTGSSPIDPCDDDGFAMPHGFLLCLWAVGRQHGP
ncbi:transposase [Streptomyces sp. NPDC017202]|uniref:transposase n=1 Tax=Streptomyces sp. NPDC017202 TaxID=3364981 RepID=UPI0037BD24B2